MITKCPYIRYDGTQWFLKFIQSAKGGLNKFYINIYHISRIRDLDKNAWKFFHIFCWCITGGTSTKNWHFYWAQAIKSKASDWGLLKTKVSN